MSRRMPARTALALAALLVAGAAQAHRPWIAPSATLPEPDRSGETIVSVDAAVSEDLFEFDSFPLQLDTLVATGPDGATVAGDGRSAARRHVSFDVKLPSPGTWRLGGSTEVLMASWKAGDETKRWRGTAAEAAQAIPADAKDVSVSRQRGRVETFVTEGAATPVAAPTGPGLGLQPLTSPTDLSTGDTTRFRLTLDGKPLADADVTVIRGGGRYRYKLGEIALKTDAKGEFAVTWPEAGRWWLGVNHGPAGRGGGPLAAPVIRDSYAATFEVLPK